MRCRRGGLVLLVAALAWAPAVYAQEADVVGRYAEAVGGADAVAAIQTLRKTGTYVYNGLEHPIVVLQKRDSGCREEIEGLSYWGSVIDEETRTVRAWDGENAWVGTESDELKTQPMGKGEVPGFVLDAEIGGSLADVERKGHAVEVVGAVREEGQEVFHLTVTRSDGIVEQWFLDAATLLPVKRTTEVPDREYKAAMTWYFDDYREVAGVQMPFYVLVEEPLFSREYIFDAIEVNVPVADDSFTQPPGTEVPPES